MNIGTTFGLTDFIRRLRSELGLTVLLIEHDMRVVMGISDRVTVLDYGEVIAEGSPTRSGATASSRPTWAAARRRPDMALLELKDVHTYYGAIHALRGITMSIDEGEIVTLIGSNGAGKSTTLRTISGLLRPRQGEIRLRGARIDGRKPHEIVELGICRAPEGAGVRPHERPREPRDGGLLAQGPRQQSRGRLRADL